MKRIKIIERGSRPIKEFEEEVGEFLTTHDYLDIQYQSYLIPYEGTEHTVMITYND
jgi:hypothetical protein